MPNRGRLLIYNTISSLFLQIVTIVSGFILPNYFIKYYGAESYGVIVSVTQYLQLISLCELGIGAVIQSALYKPIALSDMKRISSIYVASRHLFRNIACILLCYVIFLFTFYPILSGGQVSWLISIPIIFAIALKFFLQYYFGITYRILLNAAQLVYIQASISCITLLVNLLLCILLIKNNCSISIVLILSSIVFILQPLLMHWAVYKNFDINPKAAYNKHTIPQKWNGIYQHLATVTLENVPVILLTAMTSISTVAIYAIYHMITNGVKLAFTTVLSNMNPLLGNLIANNETELLTKTFKRFIWLTNNVGFLFFTTASIVIIPFLKVYTSNLSNNTIYILPAFGFGMCFAMLIYVLRLPFNYLIQAAGHYKQTQNSAIIEVALNLVITIIGIKTLGLIGVAIGLSIALSYRLLYFLIYVKKLLPFSIGQYAKLIISQFIFSGIFISISQIIDCTSCASYYCWVWCATKVFSLGALIYFLGNILIFPNYTMTVFSKLSNRI